MNIIFRGRRIFVRVPPSMLAVLVVLGISTSAQADFCMSYGVARVAIGGGMDGNSFLGGGGSVEVLPKQEDATGYEIAIGFCQDGVSADFGITRSKHDGEWGGADYKSEFRSFNMDVKVPFLGKYRVKPLFIIGLGFTQVRVKDGSAALNSNNTLYFEDATYTGEDFRLGLGAAIHFHKHVIVELQSVYRYGSYDRVNGITSGSISDSDVNGDGTTTSAILKVAIN